MPTLPLDGFWFRTAHKPVMCQMPYFRNAPAAIEIIGHVQHCYLCSRREGSSLLLLLPGTPNVERVVKMQCIGLS